MSEMPLIPTFYIKSTFLETWFLSKVAQMHGEFLSLSEKQY